MKASLLKSVIPAILVIVALAAGTSLLAGYIDKPGNVPQPAAEAQCDGRPMLNTDGCPKTAGAVADPQTNATPCTGMAAGTTPCTGAEGCPMPCCQKAGETPAAGCTMAQPQTAGCPFMDASKQAVSPCGTGGCTQVK